MRIYTCFAILLPRRHLVVLSSRVYLSTLISYILFLVSLCPLVSLLSSLISRLSLLTEPQAQPILYCLYCPPLLTFSFCPYRHRHPTTPITSTSSSTITISLASIHTQHIASHLTHPPTSPHHHLPGTSSLTLAMQQLKHPSLQSGNAQHLSQTRTALT